jgi:hypothetical protein
MTPCEQPVTPSEDAPESTLDPALLRFIEAMARADVARDMKLYGLMAA